jgi:O-antigen/teichoic acid export membrane protein
MSRVRSASRNYASSIFASAVTLVVGFFATPWLLRWLGTERMGAFRVTADWYGYLSLLELGLGGALWPLLARAISREDDGKVRDYLVAAIRAYSLVLLAMVGAGFVLAVFIRRLVHVGPHLSGDLSHGAMLMLATPLLLPLFAPFRALLEARQESYWVNMLITIQLPVITGASLVLAKLGFGITGQVLALLVGALVLQVPIVRWGMKQYSHVLLQAMRHRPDPEARREIRKLNGPTLTVNVCGRINFLTDNIVVAAIMSPAAVVPFILTQKLALLVQAQLQNIGGASWAGLAELHAHGEHAMFRTRLLELTRITAVAGIAALIPIAAYNHQFVVRWVGAIGFGGGRLTALACLNALLLSLVSLWSWVFTATGEIKRIVGPLAVQTAINITFSVLLTYRGGMLGPVAGTTVALLSVSAWMLPRLLHRTFGVPLGELARAIAYPALLGLPYAAIIGILAYRYTAARWTDLLAEMVVAGLLYLLAAYNLILNAGERRMWGNRLRLVLNRRIALTAPCEEGL